MQREQILRSLVTLGERIKTALADGSLQPLLDRAFYENGWFTQENSARALRSIAEQYLNEQALRDWLSAYPERDPGKPVYTVGIVMAGNLPLVGWHDLMCVLLSGHKAQVKLSTKDKALSEHMITELLDIEPALTDYIQVADQLKGFDAVIATGSGNTARYFEYYFGKYPHIIRKNRTAVAVLTGEETTEELSSLGDDIFTYFGLGCRNVSKVFVPRGYSFNQFYESVEHWQPVMDHNKYQNNYMYNKSLLLLNREPHLDNGFLMLQEKEPLASPMAILYYEYYDDVEEVFDRLTQDKDSIQCVVGRPEAIIGAIPFGQAQSPGLGDYADRVDTMAFLLSL